MTCARYPGHAPQKSRERVGQQDRPVIEDRMLLSSVLPPAPLCFSASVHGGPVLCHPLRRMKALQTASSRDAQDPASQNSGLVGENHGAASAAQGGETQGKESGGSPGEAPSLAQSGGAPQWPVDPPFPPPGKKWIRNSRQALDQFGVLVLSESLGSDGRQPAACRVPTDSDGGLQAQGC